MDMATAASAAPATTGVQSGVPPPPAGAGLTSETSSVIASDFQLPPGFRFHPTDEELVVHYLARKLASNSFQPAPIITEIDLYKFDPWELPAKSPFGEKEWYFFSPRDRKYPNGVRPNRAAASGYWKATGTDKLIFSTTDGRKIGVKKALVFYKGRAPKGVKTNWIMHEYRLLDAATKAFSSVRRKGSLRLDDWVLCRIYKKKAKTHNRMSSMKTDAPSTKKPLGVFDDDILSTLPEIDDERMAFTAAPRLSNKFVMDPNAEALMQMLLTGGGHERLSQLNHLIPMELLQRSRQTPVTEMLLPTAASTAMGTTTRTNSAFPCSKDSTTTWQQQQEQQQSEAFLDVLRQQPQHMLGGKALQQQENYQGMGMSFSTEDREVVDDTFSKAPHMLFPPLPSTNLGFSNNGFPMQNGSY